MKMYANVLRMASRIALSVGSALVRGGSHLISLHVGLNAKIASLSPRKDVMYSRDGNRLGTAQNSAPMSNTRVSASSGAPRPLSNVPKRGKQPRPRARQTRDIYVGNVKMPDGKAHPRIITGEFLQSIAKLNGVEMREFEHGSHIQFHYDGNIVNYYPFSKQRTGFRVGEFKGMRDCLPAEAIALVKDS